jgi:hypothetical protein
VAGRFSSRLQPRSLVLSAPPRLNRISTVDTIKGALYLGAAWTESIRQSTLIFLAMLSSPENMVSSEHGTAHGT